MRVYWRAVIGLSVMLIAMVVLGIQACFGQMPNGLTVAAYIAFGSGLLAFVFHRSPRSEHPEKRR